MKKTRPFILIGAGGHARVVLDCLLGMKVEILGIIDKDQALWGTRIRGVPVLGGDEVLDQWGPTDVYLVNGIGSVRLPVLRRSIFEAFKKRGFEFATVIHPSAVLAEDVELGEGCQIFAGAIIQVGAQISPNVIINTRAVVEHDCKIGAHSHIAPGVVLSGGVEIGNSCLIGTGACVIQYRRIGENVLVGAGAAVVTDLPNDQVAVGVPARIQQD